MPYNNPPNGMSPGFGPNSSNDDLPGFPLPNGASERPAPGANPNTAINSQQQLSVFFPNGGDSELESVLKPLLDDSPTPMPGNGSGNINPYVNGTPHNRGNSNYGQTVRQSAIGPVPVPPSTPGAGPFPMGGEPEPMPSPIQFDHSARVRPLQSITPRFPGSPGSTAPLSVPGTVPVAIAKASTTGPLNAAVVNTAQMAPSQSGTSYSVTHNTGPFNAFTTPQIVQSVASRILSGIPATAVLERTPDLEQMLAGRFMSALSQVPSPIPANSQPILFKLVVDEILGLGPLEPLMQDIAVTEIMVNGPQQIWVERSGQVMQSQVKFMNEDHLMRTASRMALQMGRKLDRKWPMLDGRLP
ncbi:MAG: ATPase, T2SS/T4P/T4SS family, partial [Chloroflexia bacterium]